MDTSRIEWLRAIDPTGSRFRTCLRLHLTRPDGSALHRVDLFGQGWEDALVEAQSKGVIRHLDVLHGSPEGGAVEFVAPAGSLSQLWTAAGVVPQFPFDIADGIQRWTVITERRRAQRLLATLREAGVAATLEFGREYEPERLLTGRQEEILRLAIRQGYYEVPRRVSLSALADDLGMAKSTLCVLLMRIERTLLGSLVQAGGGWRSPSETATSHRPRRRERAGGIDARGGRTNDLAPVTAP